MEQQSYSRADLRNQWYRAFACIATVALFYVFLHTSPHPPPPTAGGDVTSGALLPSDQTHHLRSSQKRAAERFEQQNVEKVPRPLVDLQTAPDPSSQQQLQQSQQLQQQASRDPYSAVAQSPHVKIISFVTEAQMPLARNFVGSLHRHRPFDPENTNQTATLSALYPITLFGLDLSPRSQQEVRLWQNVQLRDVRQDLLLGASNRAVASAAAEEDDSVPLTEALRLHALQLESIGSDVSLLAVPIEYTFSEDKMIQVAAAIQKRGYLFAGSPQLQLELESQTSDGLRWPSYPVLGMTANHVVFYEQLFLPSMACFRGYQCQPAQQKALQTKIDALVQDLKQEEKLDVAAWGLAPQKEAGQEDGYCFLLLREDVLYNYDVLLPSLKSTSKSAADENAEEEEEEKKPLIAIGMPTLSSTSLTSYTEIAPLKLFVPTFLKTVTPDDLRRFRFHIYIGFDAGDRYFDDPATLASIDTALRALVGTTPIQFSYLRFPFSKGWVTFLWNGLFVHAIRQDKADFFYQVNDDLVFEDAGWASKLVDALHSDTPWEDGFGVSGPGDRIWLNRHKLLTQALVSRKHYAIFGWLYPTEIKDWYSDDWITHVYDDAYTHTVADARITNAQSQGTRYTPCRHTKYDEALARGKAQIAEWRKWASVS